jgi:hypothetical protein
MTARPRQPADAGCAGPAASAAPRQRRRFSGGMAFVPLAVTGETARVPR